MHYSNTQSNREKIFVKLSYNGVIDTTEILNIKNITKDATKNTLSLQNVTKLYRRVRKLDILKSRKILDRIVHIRIP